MLYVETAKAREGNERGFRADIVTFMEIQLGIVKVLVQVLVKYLCG